ncbi:MAG TPA: hypothetical protein DEF85_10995 [Clostridiaceae bacterium]|jgi:spore germination protein (amino acid permease)|nr:hypothetical protein [Clostridiaceae bacterium]HBF77959.1 hypothetical protein [Clostridiaceae bacterium]HBG38319.1 hypothetical protein [Clostridiaceae bacterium]HBN28535.1 hypothetical protein [Clostridiaceae bacterium]HBX49402.1 hypothetical protein [Clostridiaceae bacterium]
MDEKNNNLLTDNELMFFLVGLLVGPASSQFPNILIKVAMQDAWISAIIALIYPIAIVLLSSIIIKNNPCENMINLTQKHYGSIIGNIFNIIFLLEWILTASISTYDTVTILRTYLVSFLSVEKTLLVVLAITAYGAYKGLKTLGKFNELISYFMLLFVLISLISLKEGSLTNLQPVFDSGIKNIVKASRHASYYYLGFEALPLIYPAVKNKQNIKRCGLKAVMISGGIWVTNTLITIYHLGIDVSLKKFWPYTAVYDSIHFPAINNFKYIFELTWHLVILKLISNYYFLSSYSLSNILNVNFNKICLYLYPLLFFISYKVINISFINLSLNTIFPMISTFNIIFFAMTAILSVKRSKKANVKGAS